MYVITSNISSNSSDRRTPGLGGGWVPFIVFLGVFRVVRVNEALGQPRKRMGTLGMSMTDPWNPSGGALGNQRDPEHMWPRGGWGIRDWLGGRGFQAVNICEHKYEH